MVTTIELKYWYLEHYGNNRFFLKKKANSFFHFLEKDIYFCPFPENRNENDENFSKKKKLCSIHVFHKYILL